MSQARSKFDGSFSKSMEYMPIARAFLRHYLPPHLLQVADLDTLVRIDRINTSSRLKQRRKDIAYRLQIKGGHTLLIYIEHQSRADITMPLGFLSYNIGDLYGYLEEYEEIPLVFNLLSYHGKISPYPHKSTLQDYYTHREWGSRELSMRIHVVDHIQQSSEELRTHGPCAPVELLLKHGQKS